MNNLPKIGVPLLIALTFGLLLVAKSIVTIGSGEAGSRVQTIRRWCCYR